MSEKPGAVDDEPLSDSDDDEAEDIDVEDEALSGTKEK
jgi:hypothetical protein